MITVPPTFRRMPRWWHDDAGRAWLEELPTIVRGACARWSLTVDGPPWHGSNALVVPVARAGERLALRVAPPGDDVAVEARALRFWDGRGTVALYDVDADRGAMLIERLDGDVTLTSLPVPEAVGVLARLVITLAVPVVDQEVTTTSALAADLARSLESDWERLGRPIPRDLLDEVLRVAEERGAAECGNLAVDGDLHFGQVLRAERAPWLAVDPVLLRGDAEYDVGRVLWSRLDEVGSDAEVRALFDLFVGVAEVPAERARSWVLIRAASYLMWGLRHGLTEDPPRCRRLLAVFG